MDKLKYISSRLSLRKPQEEALLILSEIIKILNSKRDDDLEQKLKKIKEIFPSVKEFERHFPSICFALATGVGKTRLMGAFVSYLYLNSKSRHFLILAPNLTIYEKLKEDFSPNSPKYVFKGIQEFASIPPIIVTGENYESGAGIRFDGDKYFGQSNLFLDNDTPIINIFNISKINSKENKNKSIKSNIPRIKRLQETIGESYFEYLGNLSDLVILMDEAHRYRSSAGSKAINELNPMLGIELTATPKKVGNKPLEFKNIVYSYSLSEALRDGYIKEPAVATRKNFNPSSFNSEELENIKLNDAIIHHENVKVNIEIFRKNAGQKRIKPFVLIVAKDTNHAETIRIKLESKNFFQGSYIGKVATIHSKLSGSEEDFNIHRLISIEDPNESTEIVIHVNKLKEGWDVTNLYTIVPLRASASEILTEQTLGRGLRLPYSIKTGVEAVDTLTIIAHDKFQEIIDKANKEDSIIKKKIVLSDDINESPTKLKLIEVPTNLSLFLNEKSLYGSPHRNIEIKDTNNSNHLDKTYEKNYTKLIIESITINENLDKSKKLSDKENQDKIFKDINLSKRIENDELNDLNKKLDQKYLIKKVTEAYDKFIIDIPNIVLIPSRDDKFGFNDFNLQNLNLINFQPLEQEIIIKDLRKKNTRFLEMNEESIGEDNLENYIICNLIDKHFIDYEENADLLYKLSSQMIERLNSYLRDKEAVKNVLLNYKKEIVEFIESQLKENIWESPKKYQVSCSRGFTPLKPINIFIKEGEFPRDFRDIPKSKKDIRNMVFTGFKKCCHPLQKFDSVDGELRFAQILEDDHEVILWTKPAKGFFKIEYKNGFSYEPDFVVETASVKYICEPKMTKDLENKNVIEKKSAAVNWCKNATIFANENGGKSWKYALIPHDQILSNMSFMGLMNKFSISES